MELQELNFPGEDLGSACRTDYSARKITDSISNLMGECLVNHLACSQEPWSIITGTCDICLVSFIIRGFLIDLFNVTKLKPIFYKNNAKPPIVTSNLNDSAPYFGACLLST